MIENIRPKAKIRLQILLSKSRELLRQNMPNVDKKRQTKARTELLQQNKQRYPETKTESGSDQPFKNVDKKQQSSRSTTTAYSTNKSSYIQNI